ncbi:hypothetical protein J2Z37_000923 [Ammoniphilus resinae]|uniref:Uncharacterized protein n=1 Tax=Ammoniphilus resinae TaxID=861532 RepID=A0ABS4GKX9_9BACL|nr:hypothetical protein [Ammoniphilus resinae]
MNPYYRPETSSFFSVENGENVAIDLALKREDQMKIPPILNFRLKFTIHMKTRYGTFRKRFTLEHPLKIGQKLSITEKSKRYVKEKSPKKRKTKRKKKHLMYGKMKVKIKLT